MRGLSIQPQLKLVSYYLGVPLLVTCFFWLTSSQTITAVEFTSCLFLLFVPWWAYRIWAASTRRGIPLFALISLIYWLYFAFPLFWGDHSLKLWSFLETDLSEEAITNAVLLAALGVTCMWLGMKTGIGQSLVPKRVLTVTREPIGHRYLRLILVGGMFLSLFESFPYLLGPSVRQFLTVLQSSVPMVAFAILLREFLRGRVDVVDKGLLLAFLLVNSVVAVSSGWLGSLAALIALCAVVYLEERKRIPVLAVCLVVACFLFFQVGKEEFRKTYWYGEAEGGKLDRVAFWVESSVESWSSALSDPTGREAREAVFQSLSRVSLLSQTANVIEMTPSIVPYQGTLLYRYIAVTFIPRFLWPNKPSINDANQFYQVEYGLTREEDLEDVSISVGILTEGFISFGILGSVIVMLIVGIFFDFFQKTFLSRDSGILFRAIGVVLIFQLTSIESQCGQYFGGLVQQAAVILLVMFPVLRIVDRKSPRNVPGAQWAETQPQPEF